MRNPKRPRNLAIVLQATYAGGKHIDADKLERIFAGRLQSINVKIAIITGAVNKAISLFRDFLVN